MVSTSTHCWTLLQLGLPAADLMKENSFGPVVPCKRIHPIVSKNQATTSPGIHMEVEAGRS